MLLCPCRLLLSCKGFGEDYVELDQRKTGSTLYLHLLWKRVRTLMGRLGAAAAVIAAVCNVCRWQQHRRVFCKQHDSHAWQETANTAMIPARCSGDGMQQARCSSRVA